MPNSLGALGHGTVGQLSGQLLVCGRLYLSGTDGQAFLVMCQVTCFSSDTFSNVIDKGVQDAHGLG